MLMAWGDRKDEVHNYTKNVATKLANASGWLANIINSTIG